MSIFSYLILKTKYYKHQFISMIIIVILGFGLNIIIYFQLDDTEEDGLNFLYIFIQFIIELCLCLDGVIMKYNLEKNYCEPYEFSLWEGVFGFILHSICLAIFCGFKLSSNGIKHPDNLIQYFNEFDYNDLIVCLSMIITYFIYNISIIWTCDYFTPIHILIILILIDTYGIFTTDSNLALNFLGFFILIFLYYVPCLY